MCACAHTHTYLMFQDWNWHNGLLLNLWCWHPIWTLAQIVAAPFLGSSLLAAWETAEDGSSCWDSVPTWEIWRNPLAPNFGACSGLHGHWGSDLEIGRYSLSLSIWFCFSPFLSVLLSSEVHKKYGRKWKDLVFHIKTCWGQCLAARSNFLLSQNLRSSTDDAEASTGLISRHPS